MGLEPTIDVISRTNYVSTAYKTASLLSYIGGPTRICTQTKRVRASCAAVTLEDLAVHPSAALGTQVRQTSMILFHQCTISKTHVHLVDLNHLE